MQEAVQGVDTAMVAINLPYTDVQTAIATLHLPGVCEISGITNPRQTLVSGHTSSVYTLTAHLKATFKAVFVPMQVSAPFHCSLMRPASLSLAQYIADLPITAPRIPIIASATGQVVSTAERLKRSLCENVVAPMQLVRGVETALERGVRKFVEVGPRRKMGKQVWAIAGALPGVSVSHYESEDKR